MNKALVAAGLAAVIAMFHPQAMAQEASQPIAGKWAVSVTETEEDGIKVARDYSSMGGSLICRQNSSDVLCIGARNGLDLKGSWDGTKLILSNKRPGREVTFTATLPEPGLLQGTWEARMIDPNLFFFGVWHGAKGTWQAIKE